MTDATDSTRPDADGQPAEHSPDRSVVVPVYDERPDVWTALVERLRAAGWDEVVVCLDAPDDDTARAAERVGEHAGVALAVSDDRRGKGGALRDGLATASGDVLGYVDADGAVAVEALDRLYRSVEWGTAAVAAGSRDAGDADRTGQSLLRRTLGRGYRLLARGVTGVPVTDFQCGAKAFRREVWDAVAADVDETGFAFDTELLALAHRRGFDIREVPIAWDDPGDSDVDVGSDVPDLLRSLARIRGTLRTTPRALPDGGDDGGAVATEPTDGDPPDDTADRDAAAEGDGGGDADADDPMHVALVTSHPPNRGHLAEYGEELARAYAARDDTEVTVLARRTDRAPAVEDRGDYEVRRVWERDAARSAWRLFGELRDGDYDAVQFNLHMTYFGTTNAYRFLGLALPPLCRATLDVPVVTTLHDLLEIVEEDHVDDTVGTLERVGARAATQLVLLSDATTVTAAEYRDVVADRYPLGEAVHVPHGTFVRADGGAAPLEPPLRLLVFGFLGPTKDIETTVRAFRDVRTAVPDAELVIAGGSHPDYPGHREELESRFGDDPGVEFIGYVEEDELDDVWGSATAVLMPYHTCTGVSGVFQLAKSYGKPVVAFENDGMRTSTVETGGDAAFVDPGSPAALAEGIVDLWDDRERLRDIARANAAAGDAVSMTETTDRFVELLADPSTATAAATDGGEGA
ncbi:glycosyltransferase [Halobaculum lipolyticum]|uniref:Glycosyltransferase n=1 Tax=Halobaculum lipolyticum TaxID=3032001 RepID=A0ABD5WHX1_9EURY|nr:glycosyltransferase [Halobaculum sp. DT31]